MVVTALTLTSMSDLDRIAGPINPSNPVKMAVYRALQNASGQPVRVIVSNDPLGGFELETTEFETDGEFTPGVVHGTVERDGENGLRFTPAPGQMPEPVATHEQFMDFLNNAGERDVNENIRQRLVANLALSWPEHVGYPAPIARSRISRVDYAVALTQHIGDIDEYRRPGFNAGLLVNRGIAVMRLLGNMVMQGSQPGDRAVALDMSISREAFQMFVTISLVVGSERTDDGDDL